MTEPLSEQSSSTKRKAGSIRQYATLGRSKTSERQDVETLRSPDTQTSAHRSIEEVTRSEEETSERQSIQESERSGVETPKRKRHTIYFPPELSKWVKVHAAETEAEISDIVTEALERYKSEIEHKG